MTRSFSLLNRETTVRTTTDVPSHSKLQGRKRLTNVAAIELDRIEADPQTREEFDELSLQRLAGSLREHGQLQPCRVRWDEERGKYILIAGERRWRAARIAGMESVDCVIVEGSLSQGELLLEQITENAIREDLSPLETARAYSVLMEVQGWNRKQIAKHLHLNPSSVTRTLQLLQLPPDIQARVDAGELAARDALAAVTKTQETKGGKKTKGRESRLKVSIGSVTIKSRRLLDASLVEAALEEALNAVRTEQGREAA